MLERRTLKPDCWAANSSKATAKTHGFRGNMPSSLLGPQDSWGRSSDDPLRVIQSVGLDWGVPSLRAMPDYQIPMLGSIG
ncbi:hypothetical protein CGCF413_v003915 [Colletotrichum fructicola]|nr:hypothetical protein CFRS1_v010955 [Colletotrichum fructicola]KAF5509725.1 hypothetical protein CGCF413_v003915 [Colletotrichum fructicola]